MYKNLVHLNMNESQSIMEFLEQWRGVLDSVVGVGLKVDEYHQIQLLLATLPNTTRSFITTKGYILDHILLDLAANIFQEHSIMVPTLNPSNTLVLIMLTINLQNRVILNDILQVIHPTNQN